MFIILYAKKEKGMPFLQIFLFDSLPEPKRQIFSHSFMQRESKNLCNLSNNILMIPSS